MVTRLWKFLNTDLKDLASLGTVDGTVDVADKTFKLAETLNKDEIEKIAPIIEHGASLLDFLNSPLGELAESTLPFVKIATGLLKFYLKQTAQEPTLAQSIALVSQAAYLESFRDRFKALLASATPAVQARLKQAGEKPASEAIKQQMKQLGDRLEALELDDQAARRAIVFFHESEFARAFNEVLSARLQQIGIQVEQANRIAEQVARNTDRYLLPALASAGGATERLVKWYQMGGQAVLEKYASIDSYLEQKIQPRPDDPVFNERFSFRQIYVPLQAQAIDRNGEPNRDQPEIELEQWAMNLLTNPGKQGQVLFIQGGPGRGKSVFCRMFADRVREQLHPSWTPILIRLRDVRTLEKDFEETLRGAVDQDFARSDPGWLTDRHIRFLFLLDGFDELLMEGRTSGGLEEFLKQVGRFQDSCVNHSEKGHRVLITGRSLSLQSIQYHMPSNLERVEILPMSDDLQDRWLGQWGKLIAANPTHLKEILRDARLPDRVKELAKEPLLLYLLAAMHRDGELSIEMFEGANEASAKVLIYEKTLDWVLNQQRTHRGENLNPELTGLDSEALRRILTEAGLCVVQSGGECAPIAMIEDRLKNDDQAKALLEQVRERLNEQKSSPLRNALAAFYMQQGRGGSGSIEFVHKSFSEFLCAERLREAIEDWSKPGARRGDLYLVRDEQMHWEVYDLLGYGGLTLEIVGYLMALLSVSTELEPVRLFQRLESFYLRWCNGEFIDSFPENLPQKKMLQLQGVQVSIGLRQVDVFAGLNVMILLLELNRYAKAREDLKAQIVFYPCGEPATAGFSQSRLINIIGYSCCIDSDAFNAISFNAIFRKFLNSASLSSASLSSASLSSANLSSANLSSANLSSANLSGANLSGANLSGANLSSADLSSANLSGANLSSADLSSANLFSANLSGVNLSSADLSSANIISADLSSADLSGANLSSADLSSADLFSANLSSAELSSANLSSAELSSANLSSAYLSSAYLSSANLSSANLSSANLARISWDEYTQWEDVQGLESAINVPEALKKRLGLE
jgi:uncharacterized protein YjbI with pentapeptide repeats